jgi:hypothetical protein
MQLNKVGITMKKVLCNGWAKSITTKPLTQREMIGGVQKKILLTQDENGNLRMDDEMGKLLFGDPNPIKNYKLVRESDGLTKHGQTAGWIEWKKKDKTFKKLHDKPAVGRSFILDPNRMSFTWCTSTVTEVLEERENYCKFKTQNSVITNYGN